MNDQYKKNVKIRQTNQDLNPHEHIEDFHATDKIKAGTSTIQDSHTTIHNIHSERSSISGNNQKKKAKRPTSTY